MTTYRVGVFLNLAAGKFRRGAKAAAQDTDRLGGSLRKAAGSGSLMGRGIADGARRASREMDRSTDRADRLGRRLQDTGRSGERSLGRLLRSAKGVRAQLGLAAGTAGRLGGRLGGVAAFGGGSFALAAGVKRVASMEERMVRLGIQSKRSREDMERLRQEIYATANLPEIRLDASQLLAVVEAIVEKTGDIDFARDNLLTLAQAVQGSGGTGDAIGRLAAELRKLDIKSPEGVARMLNLIVEHGKEASFTLGKFSAESEKLFSAFAPFGYRGVEGGRQLSAISQLAATGATPGPESASAVEALLRTLSDRAKIDTIWDELGVDVRNAEGGFRPLDQVLKEIIAAAHGDIVNLSGIFDETARRAIAPLLTEGGMAKYDELLRMPAPTDALARDAAEIADTIGAKVQEKQTDWDDLLQRNLTGPLGVVASALGEFAEEIVAVVGILGALKAMRAGGNLFRRAAGREAGYGKGIPPETGAASKPKPTMMQKAAGKPAPKAAPKPQPEPTMMQKAAGKPAPKAAPKPQPEPTMMQKAAGKPAPKAAPKPQPEPTMMQKAAGKPAPKAAPKPQPEPTMMQKAAGKPAPKAAPKPQPEPTMMQKAAGKPAPKAAPKPQPEPTMMQKAAGKPAPKAAPKPQPEPTMMQKAAGKPAPKAAPKPQPEPTMMQKAAGKPAPKAAPKPQPEPTMMQKAAGKPAPKAAPRSTLMDKARGVRKVAARGAGPAAVLGAAAYATANPDDEIAREAAKIGGGLAGSTLLTRAAGLAVRGAPGMLKIPALGVAGLAGWVGGEEAVEGFLDGPDILAADADRIASERERHDAFWAHRRQQARKLKALREELRKQAEVPVVELPKPPELRRAPVNADLADQDAEEEEAGLTGGRPRRSGRGDVHVTVNVGPITSESSDPVEIAEQVADEIERRQTDSARRLYDTLLADPTPEATH